MSTDEPNHVQTSVKRKHDEDAGTRNSKRRKRRDARSQKHQPAKALNPQEESIIEKPAQQSTIVEATSEEPPSKTALQKLAKDVKVHRQPLWNLSAPRAGRFADRDPIFIQDRIVTAVGDQIRVFDITTSLVVAVLQPPPRSSIVSFDAIRTQHENLVRILYSNGVLVDWDWTSNSKDNSQLAAKNVDLYRLVAVKDRLASISTTWSGKSEILLDGITIHKTEHRILDLRVLHGTSVVVALCQKTVLLGRKAASDKYTWIELPWSQRLTCFDAREVRDTQGHEFSLAVGLEDGVIQLYNNLSSLFSSGSLPSPRVLHWHRNAVASVKFSPDGNYIVSGGQETVLVMWQLETGQKSFLPNLTTTIKRIVVSPSGNRYALKMGDNSIMVLSTTELKPVANLAGLQAPLNQALVAAAHPTINNHLLLSVPSSQQTSTRPFLQTYDIAADKHISRQALTRNNVTDFTDSPNGMAILPPDVDLLSVSQDGQWLATVDTWTPPLRDLTYLATEEYMDTEEKVARKEVFLKFWQWNAVNREWMLNSRIDQPHPVGLKPGSVFKLVSDKSRNGFVTIGEDSIAKIWRPQRKMRDNVAMNEQEIEWICRKAIELEKAEDRTDVDVDVEGLSPSGAALTISDDGSLLAVSMLHGDTQTIDFIDTETGEIKSSHDNIAAADLVELAFMDRWLIALSRRTVRVWDVVEDKLQFATKVSDSLKVTLAVSRHDNVFAVALPASSAAPDAVLVVQLSTETQTRVETGRPVAALLAHPNARGFTVVYQDATISTLSSTHALSTMQQQTALDQELEIAAAAAAAAADTAQVVSYQQLLEPESAIVSSEAQVEDDRVVVRPEQLAKIFDVGTNAAALPSVREMFHAVASLFGRKPGSR